MKNLALARFDELLERLRAAGYETLGPVVRDGAVVHDTVAGLADFPAGWCSEQTPGRYRLARGDTPELFAYVLAAASWKPFLFVPERVLFRVTRDARGALEFAPTPRAAPRRALVGVRPCELHGIAGQDAILADGPYPDEDYAARRAAAFIIAVHCTRAVSTCFCTSQRTGPRASGGYDLALTELVEDGPHRFTVEAGSAAGSALLAELKLPDATAADRDASETGCARAAAQIRRRLDPHGLPAALLAHPEHPRWDDVAARCLGCGNCTLVCPTCFCFAVDDRPELAGPDAIRSRRWDSCFDPAHSYIAGGTIRLGVRARYRQWLTHKLATWHDQFGRSGCVGCGRCITWCPVGIDITEEANAVRRGESHGTDPAP